MWGQVRLFLKERFPPAVTLPLTFVLFAGPASLTFMSWPQALAGWLTVFLGLFCLRMADDLSDLETDRVAHPERVLASGKISEKSLKAFIGLASGVIFLLNFRGPELALVAAAALFYGLYFMGVKKRLPIIWRAFWSNAVFALVPLYVLRLGGGLRGGHWWLAAFVWLGAVAHEWAHNVRGPGEALPGPPGYSELLGPRLSATVALGLFLLAAGCGFMSWWGLGRPPAFGLLLLGTFLKVGHLGGKLLREPSASRARPFYVFGFVFFLLPLAGLVVDRAFGWLTISH